MVFKTVWDTLSNTETLETIVNNIYSLHQKNSQDNSLIKSLEQQRADVVKASNNLIKAIEQGIITEQTRSRLKELEAEIHQYDFDIEQAKQRTYSYLTPTLVRDFLQKTLCRDIDNIAVRKTILRTFIREIILYNNKIVIVFNFSDDYYLYEKMLEDVDEIENTVKQAEKSASKNNYRLQDSDSSSPRLPYSKSRIRQSYFLSKNARIISFILFFSFTLCLVLLVAINMSFYILVF